MYLSELIGGLRRRWWLVAIGLLCTATLTYTAYSLVPPVQEARASVLVLPPAKAAGDSGNPYLVLGGLEPAADMLAAAMNSGALHESLAPAKGSAKFEVARDTSSSGPLLVVDVTGTDPVTTLALLNTVVETMPNVLTQLQAQVGVRSETNLMTLTEITRDTKPEPSIKTQLRATLVAAVMGLALTLFGTNAIDGLLLRRSRRRRASRVLSNDDTGSENAVASPSSAGSPATGHQGRSTAAPSSQFNGAQSQMPHEPQQVDRGEDGYNMPGDKSVVASASSTAI